MAQITNRKLDPIAKTETVTIQDELGATMLLRHPLTLDDYDPEAEEAAAMALMDENVRKYRERTAGRS